MLHKFLFAALLPSLFLFFFLINQKISQLFLKLILILKPIYMSAFCFSLYFFSLSLPSLLTYPHLPPFLSKPLTCQHLLTLKPIPPSSYHCLSTNIYRFPPFLSALILPQPFSRCRKHPNLKAMNRLCGLPAAGASYSIV